MPSAFGFSISYVIVECRQNALRNGSLPLTDRSDTANSFNVPRAWTQPFAVILLYHNLVIKPIDNVNLYAKIIFITANNIRVAPPNEIRQGNS